MSDYRFGMHRGDPLEYVPLWVILREQEIAERIAKRLEHGWKSREERNSAMVAMRKQGLLYREIGDVVGLSRERVWQIVKART